MVKSDRDRLKDIRRHPARYIGDTGVGGLHCLVLKALSPAVNESSNGRVEIVTIILHADGSCTVEDDGFGRPVDDLSTCSADDAYQRDFAVINALSEWVEVKVSVHQAWTQRYKRGALPPGRKPAIERISCETRPHGTSLRFKPDRKVFKKATFSVETLSKQLNELARQNPALMFAIETREGVEDEPHRDEPRPIFLCGRGTSMFI